MAKNPQDINFSKALARLEEIVAKLEEPDLDLEEGLKLLKVGVGLHKMCKDKLTVASTEIETILKDESSEVEEVR